MTPVVNGWRALLFVVLTGFCAALSAQSPQPAAKPAAELRVKASLAGTGELSVGATSTLYLDVLTSTWFTDAPTLPVLNLPNVLVTQPSGEASQLRSTFDGVPFNGLRYSYLISPTVPGTVQIPALTVSASVGESSSPLQASSLPLRVQAAGAPSQGSAPGTPGQSLAASSVQATQRFTDSAQPLAVGDRISREVLVKAIGAQAMLIPPLAFADIDGLKRYVAQPTLNTLSDARGGFEGGQRIDRVDYVVERPGTYDLPAMDLAWWNINTKTQEHLTLPARRVQAQAGSGEPGPFSVADDVRSLSEHARFYVHGRWFALLAIAASAALVLWFAWPWCRRGQRWLVGGLVALQARRKASEPYAWHVLRRALSHPDQRLDALYRWLRRSRDASTLEQALRPLSEPLRTPGEAVLRDCYGPNAEPARAWEALRAMAPRWRRAFRARSTAARCGGLQPLNPGSPTDGTAHRAHKEQAL